MVIVNRDHLDVAHNQLRGLPPESVLVQPCNRDTGPGVLFVLLHLAHREPEAIVAVFPSDHYVADDRAFMAHVARATRLAERFPEKVVILGIQPEVPDTGYGYIAPAGPLRGAGRAFHVGGFWEKPTVDLARQLVTQGGLWNSFVMVFQLSRMLDLLQMVAPEEFGRMWALSRDASPIQDVYHNLTPWNFSRNVLARIPEHLIVLRVDDVHWSDWGTRESIDRTLRALKKDPPWRVLEAAPAAA
jgi:mannose-1-phosphate guanylyltransferase